MLLSEPHLEGYVSFKVKLMQLFRSVFQLWYMYVGMGTSSKHLYIIMQFNTITLQRTLPL